MVMHKAKDRIGILGLELSTNKRFNPNNQRPTLVFTILNRVKGFKAVIGQGESSTWGFRWWRWWVVSSGIDNKATLIGDDRW